MQKVKISSTPIILKNINFQSIIVTVMFPFDVNVEDLAKIQLLPLMLNRMNNAYQTEEEFQLEKKKIYILGVGCSKMIIGTTGFFTFDLYIPDVKSLKEDILEEQFSFFKELIYNPKIENKGFDKSNLEREVKNVKLGMSNALNNIRPYHNKKLKSLIDDQGILSRDLIYQTDLLDFVTPENLYEYYLEVVKNNQPIIYAMGDIDSKRLNELCNKYLYKEEFMEKEITINKEYYLIPRKDVLEVEENSKFKDSIYSLVYKVKDMKKEDEVLLNALRDILASISSRLLDIKLRDEFDLIYYSKVASYAHYGCFEITVFINKKNIDLVKEKLFELIDDFKNEELISESLKNIKERKKLDLIRQLDDKYFLFDDFIMNDLGVDVTYSEYIEEYNKITAKDISDFVDRLVLDTTYFLKEKDDE